MKKVKIIIIYIIKNIIRIIVELLLKSFCIIIPKSKNIFLIGLKQATDNKYSNKSDVFMHNTKVFFLYLQMFHKDIKTIYLCDDEYMRCKLKKRGYTQVYKRLSLLGLWYTYRAGFCFYDQHRVDCINGLLPSGKGINFWHGIPLKKIMDDNDNHHIRAKLPSFLKFLYKLIREHDSFYIANSEYDASKFLTAFSTSQEKIKILGSPRNDILLNDLENEDLFMEDDFAKVKLFKKSGKKLFFYMPTYRDTGKDISGWLKTDKLHSFLKNKNAILICKLHFCDCNSLNFKLPQEIYKMDSNSDIYPLLKYSDALITDYSSVYFDYLLLDKPILYYSLDLDEYQENCHGFYEPYENLTAGVKAYNEQELINAMQDVINGIDNYKEERKALRDRMFKYQDGHNCERVVEFIRSLDK